LDPVEILGEHSAAAASGDMATLIAVNDAHPVLSNNSIEGGDRRLAWVQAKSKDA
jgi:hypothetical protein